MDQKFDRRNISDLLKALFCIFSIGLMSSVSLIGPQIAVGLMLIMWAAYGIGVYCFAPYNTSNRWTKSSWLILPLAIIASAAMLYSNQEMIKATILFADFAVLCFIWYFRPMDGNVYFVEILSIDPSGDYENWWAKAKIIDNGRIIDRMLSPALANTAYVGQQLRVCIGPQHELYLAN